MNENSGLVEKIKNTQPWTPPAIADTTNIPTGDMPGDKIAIGADHIKKSHALFPLLLERLIPELNGNPFQRAVIAVCGGSGVGKSEIASLLSYYLNHMGIGSYTLSGDNYPHRIPQYNDAERLRIFRQAGLNGLIARGQYIDDHPEILKTLMAGDDDANPEGVKRHPWLGTYLQAGRNGLKNYLGTPNEINFAELTAILTQFKNGATQIPLKRMGRSEAEFWYDMVDFSGKHIVIVEWTHGNNHNLQGVDIPILLNSTPEETLAHRRARNRDGATDSPFTTMVLSIEQELLVAQAAQAKIILSKAGDILTYGEYIKTMQPAQA